MTFEGFLGDKELVIEPVTSCLHVVACLYLGCGPLPVTVSTRIITFSVGDPELNLHLPLESWEGATPNLYLSSQWENHHHGPFLTFMESAFLWMFFWVAILVYLDGRPSRLKPCEWQLALKCKPLKGKLVAVDLGFVPALVIVCQYYIILDADIFTLIFRTLIV